MNHNCDEGWVSRRRVSSELWCGNLHISEDLRGESETLICADAPLNCKSIAPSIANARLVAFYSATMQRRDNVVSQIQIRRSR